MPFEIAAGGHPIDVLLVSTGWIDDDEAARRKSGDAIYLEPHVIVALDGPIDQVHAVLFDEVNFAFRLPRHGDSLRTRAR